MGDIYQFPAKVMHIHRQVCSDCYSVLEYWLGDDDCAYGICIRCLGVVPDKIEYSDELLEGED